MLNKIFKLKENNTNIKREVLAGFITFFSMLYIIFVNPVILSQSGLDIGKAFVWTCLTIFIGCSLAAFFVNLPLVLGPALGLSAIFVYDIVLNHGYSYKTALLTVALSGAANFLIFSFLPYRYIGAIVPRYLKNGIIAGTGLFLLVIGIKLAGVVVPNHNTLGSLGNVRSVPFIFTFVCFLLLFIAYQKRIHFFPLMVFALSAIINYFLLKNSTSSVSLGSISSFHLQDFVPIGINFSDFQLPVLTACITLLFAGTCDLMGSFYACQSLQRPHSDEPVTTENKSSTEVQNSVDTNKVIKKLLLIKGISSMVAGSTAASTMTVYLESTAGISAGGRTGMVPLVVGILFLLSLFLKPLLAFVPGWASSPLLMCVGTLMFCTAMKSIDWNKYTNYVPALLAVFFIPLTYSITNGIALCLVCNVLIKLFAREHKELTVGSWVTFIIFAFYLLI